MERSGEVDESRFDLCDAKFWEKEQKEIVDRADVVIAQLGHYFPDKP